MSKIKKVELSSAYLKKDDDVGPTYCSFSEDLIFNVGYEKIKDLTLEIDDEYYAYFPKIENGLTHYNLKIKKNKSRHLTTIIKGEQGNNLQGVEVNFVADDDVDIGYLRIIATKRVIKSGGKTTFNISVFDENNNPIPNVFVELIDRD